MNYVTDLLHRASTGRKLSTREAAFLQGLKGALIGFFAPLVPYFIPVLTGQEHIVWSGEVLSALLGAFMAFVLRLYFSQNDETLGNIAEAYYQARTKQALDEMFAAGGVPIVQFSVPVVKVAAQATPPQQPTATRDVLAPQTIHDITTAPQPAIGADSTLYAVSAAYVKPPVPVLGANAAERFANQAANVVAGTPTLLVPTIPATAAASPLTQTQP